MADYYLCSIGEVYKAAYPPSKTNGEVSKVLSEERAEERHAKNIDRKIAVLTARREGVLARLRKSPTKRIAMVLWKYRNSWNWRYHLSNKIDEVTLLLLMLLPSGSIDFTGFSMKGNKSNKKIEK